MKWWLIIAALSVGGAQAEDILPDKNRSIARDALYGESLYWLHSGQYEKALGANLALRDRNRKRYGNMLAVHQTVAHLGLGMNQMAQRTYRQLLSKDDTKLVSLPARAQAWFYLGKSLYTQGLWPQALHAMRKVNDRVLNSALLNEYHFLAATLELFSGNPRKADSHILDLPQESIWATYAFLNLAVSYTERDVHIDKVEAAFNKALELSPNAENEKALSDRINLMAGQFFYETGRGRSAIKHLENISLDGAYAPKALLTYGWALTEQWRYHEALQPWYMLKTAHDPINQDVQETLITIPHILEKLNAKVLALGAFEYATQQYDIVQQQLDQSAKRLNTGLFIEPILAKQVVDKWGAFVPLDLTLPEHPDRFYLKDIMSDGYFQGQLKQLRDVHAMRQQLKKALDDLSSFDVVLGTREAEYKDLTKQKLLTASRVKEAAFKKQYQALLIKADRAFKNPDGSGLASENEKAQLKSFGHVARLVSKLNQNKLSQNKQFSGEQYEQRLRRVKGILMWQLSQRYADRKKQVSKRLVTLENELRKLKQRLGAANAAYVDAPKSFSGLPKQVNQLRKKITTQLARVEKVYQQQRRAVGGIVSEDIKQRQNRVRHYQLQARLASARLFDETSNQSRHVGQVQGAKQ